MMLSEIHQKILDRNIRETTPFLSVHEANATLLNQIDALQLKCESLERENSNQQQQLDEGSPGGKGSANAALKNETRLRDKLEKLQEELNDKLKVYSEVNVNALQTTKDLSIMKNLNTAQEATIANLKHEHDRKEKAMEHISLELDEAKKSRRLAEQQYEGLKNTIRTLQEENDVLKKENRQLVDRLVSGKEKTSDEINTLNEMVSHLKNEVDMLRTLKVQEEKRRKWFGRSAIGDEVNILDAKGPAPSRQ